MSTLLLGVTASFGQAFDVGSQVISAGVGLGSTLGGFNRATQAPAISLQYERGMWEAGNSGAISLGGYVGFQGNKYRASSYTESWNYTIIGVRSAYHYQGIQNDDLDLYGGLMLSYNYLNYKVRDHSGGVYNSGLSYGSTAVFGLYLGARYYFSPNFGGFAELGYGVSYLNLGIALRL